MELQGKLFRLLPVQTGTGKNGEWKKQEFVIETAGQFSKKVCFSMWGDKIDRYDIKEGENLIVSFDLESREYNDRWYTDAKAWKISRHESEQDDLSGRNPSNSIGETNSADDPSEENSSNSTGEADITDDLPF